MYCISGWIADYYHWWVRRVETRPMRWEVALTVGAIILTFLPAFVGVWAFVFWPVGWLFLPGIYAASRQIKRANDIKIEQRTGALRTKKLISLGQKETKR